MSFVPAPGCVRVILAQSNGDGRAYNFVWFKSALDWTQYDPFLDQTYQEYLNLLLETWWYRSIAPLQHTAMELIYIRSRVQATEGGAEIQRDTSLPGQVDAIAPNNAALCATFSTGHIGRSYRGRFYLAGIPSSVLVDGDPNHVSDDYLADYLAAISALSTLGYVAFHHVVVSHFTDGAERETAVISNVNEYAANSRIDSQRRRTRLFVA